ncbi:ABC transporter permease, partial [Brachybacterium sp. p3-SID957]|uniref:ABC transporter permease n=1 Tax=Brachybacterium sp. p3-SID957 TaxID=2916049 RepID=UPI00223AC1EC
PPAPAPGPARAPSPTGARALRLRGLGLVTSLELRQRIRSRRWYVALGLWTVALLLLGLVILAPTAMFTGYIAFRETSRVVFSLQMLLVLFAMLLVLPAMSAGSINGDRSAGTLATLQSSLISPLEIVLGKLLAGWVTGLAFLLLALPSVLPTALLGGVGPLYLLRVLLVIAALALCVTAVGLGLSAITARQLGSVVLAYVAVFGVTVVGPIMWGSSAAFLQEEREVTVYDDDYDFSDGTDDSWSQARCVRELDERTVVRLDISQPLIWPNPVLLLADVAPPMPPPTMAADEESWDLLQLMQLGLRHATQPLHPSNFNHCSLDAEGYPSALGSPANRPIWPLGLGCWFLAGGASLALATWRLAVPIRMLGKGIRIA